MAQNIIVAGIILFCVFLLGRRIYRQLRGKSGCGCSCDRCPSARPEEPADKGCINNNDSSKG